MADQLLSPNKLKFDLGGKSINITDYEINFAISNGCGYDPSTSSTKGIPHYAIQKGSLRQDYSITVWIIQVPDKKNNDDIKAIKSAYDNTRINDPKKYVTNILFMFTSNDDTIYTKIGFEGYVKDVEDYIDKTGNLSGIKAKIVVFDPMTLKIT